MVNRKLLWLGLRISSGCKGVIRVFKVQMETQGSLVNQREGGCTMRERMFVLAFSPNACQTLALQESLG